MTEADLRLQPLRGALLEAAAADLAATDPARAEEPRPRRRRSARAKLAVALVIAALAVPAAALAVRALGADQEVANGIPATSVALVGTDPSCSPVRNYVEYICLLSRSSGHRRGDVVDTVNSTGQVNGGCRAENVEGTRWRCFLGQAAVRHQLISQELLGDYRPGSV